MFLLCKPDNYLFLIPRRTVSRMAKYDLKTIKTRIFPPFLSTMNC
jgi:hypothetical protein